MAWIGTYETALWDTPSGRLGDKYYGLSGKSPNGLQAYVVELVASDRSLREVGDLRVTTDIKEIEGKTLANQVGRAYYHDFSNEQGILKRVVTTKSALDRMRNVKGEPQPEEPVDVRGGLR